MTHCTFDKAERMCSQIDIERLFSGGNKSLTAYPVRAVYRPAEQSKVTVEVLISVAKRHLRQAVDRNRCKRLLREAYRKNKHILTSVLDEKKARGEQPFNLTLALIWLADELHDSVSVEIKVRNLLHRIVEQL